MASGFNAGYVSPAFKVSAEDHYSAPSKPEYSYSKPAYTSYSKPAYTSYSYSKPAYSSYSKPAYNNYSKPAYSSYSKPAYSYDEPSYGYSKPGYDHGYGYQPTVVKKDYGLWEKYYRLETETFKKTVATDTENVWVVAFIDPTCGGCKRLSVQWEKLTTLETITVRKVKFGYMDITVEEN